jgi:hypothetical protein
MIPMMVSAVDGLDANAVDAGAVEVSMSHET